MPKRRSPGDGALYFVASQGLWRGVVDVGYDAQGRRKQKAVTSKSQRVAREKLNALKKQIAETGSAVDASMTVEKWARHWLDTVCAPTKKPDTLANYESDVRRWIVPVIGRKRVAQLRPSDIRAVSQAVLDAGRAPGTARKVHAVLSSMLESARLDGVTARNVAADVVPPALAEKERDALTTEDALRVLRAALTRPDGVRWWVAILTGMRQGERLGATIDSIDTDTHEFTVQWALSEVRFKHGCGDSPCGRRVAGSCPARVTTAPPTMTHRPLEGRFALLRPKSGHARVFPLIPALEGQLTDYLAATTTPNPHGLIWRNADGSPITPSQDQAEWRAVLHEAGVITAAQALPPKDRPEGTPDTPTTHVARHTTATVLMELGVDAKIIGEVVGHVDARTTRRYQHVSSEHARQAMDAIGARFSSALRDPAT